MPLDVVLKKLPLQGLIDIRGMLTKPLVNEHLAGMSTPDGPNARSETDDGELYWIGPEHYYFRFALNQENHWLKQLKAMENAAPISFALVSDVYNYVSVCGPDADTFLSSLTTLDFRVAGDDFAGLTEGFSLRMMLINRISGWEIGFENCYETMLDTLFAKISSAS